METTIITSRNAIQQTMIEQLDDVAFVDGITHTLNKLLDKINTLDDGQDN